MFNNYQEFWNLLPMIIIGAGIIISLIIEMYSKKSEVILPWFSIILFLAAGLHSLFYVGDISIILQNMLATGGNVNIFHAIFTVTTTGRLDDGIQPGNGSIHKGEIHINAGLNKLSADYPACEAFFKIFSHFFKNLCAMLGAHQST
ncbi:MAG: hypothetical protein BWY38_02251 [Ignavibacteria bacterium ADurb.Bin266]|nr:MAG: hypothetical protein BWY38_02251 [Ignavibacteria bacterium ADurb.Bin266]